MATGGLSGTGATAPGSGAASGSGSAASGGVPGTGASAGTGGLSAVGGGLVGAGGVAGSGGSAGDRFLRPAAEVLADLELGWNLGNSLDAPEGETAWGNPAITPELLQTVAARGFELVRIPVTWSLHMGPGPDYSVESAFLERVATVVDQAIAAGLYAIINVHHDGADDYEGVEWLTLNDAQGQVTDANNAAVKARFEALWLQIAQRFQDYGEELIFESMNEIHDGYDAPDPRYYTIVNDLNQTFLNLIRHSGGNNPLRYLVVPGYNTNIDYTLEGFALPVDTVSDHLILSVHYYDPYTYALAAETHTWGAASPNNDGWGQEEFVVEQFDKLKSTYVDQGLPVIIGEYGAVHQAGYEDYRRYYMEYVTKVAIDRGIVPVYWDNGAEGSGTENLGLFSRSSYQELHPTILDAMFRAAAPGHTLDQVALPQP